MTRPARPLTFTAFCAKVLRVRLTDGQRVLCLVAYDGLEPRDLAGGDRELARSIFGNAEVIPAESRAVLVAICGARGGKSYVLCGLRLLHLALTVPLTTLAPGEIASALVVAPDLRLARQTLRYALGAAKNTPAIRSRIRSESSDGFVIERENGHQVSIEALPATRGGSAVRGRSLVGAVLDEACFFRDEDSVVNDAEVFKAVSPRVLPAGQTIIASTPWAEGLGLAASMFAKNHGVPQDAIAAHAPTLLLNDAPAVREMVQRERERDPDNAAREYDAQAMPGGSGAFFDPHAIELAVDRLGPALPLAHDPQVAIGVGADFGFRSDSSALVVVRHDGERYAIADILEKRPQRGAPLQPSSVCREFAAVAKRYGASAVMSDRHYEEAIREHLSAASLRLVPAPDGLAGKVETYTKARALIHEGRVRLPNHPRLIAQLKAIVSKPTPGGGLTIASPRRAGAGHGDLVSALVLALASLPSPGGPWMRVPAAPGKPLFGAAA